jgi:glycosyltransferase involved in cell wall biosynthesis
MESVSASIIVCTYNRHKSLQHTLGCLAAQNTLPELAWEVIVVDNNSSDGTCEIVQAYQKTQAIPCLRYEFEEKQGLSHARNRGIRSAHGDVVLFTDDDVCPEPDWLQRVLEGMDSYDCDACGGYIAPVWDARPVPPWLTERFYGFLAIRTEDNGSRLVTEENDLPFGANMAFRRSVFDSIEVFDTNLGRKGKILASGEEIDLFMRLIASGGNVIYLPKARVHHHIEAFRMKKQYFRRWRFQNSHNIAMHFEIPGKRRFYGIPLYLLPQLFKAVGKALVGRLHMPSDEAFFQEIIVCHYLGFICGLYHMRKSVKG